jgi:hypothetical protein
MKLRLTHRTFKEFGSKILQHRYVGQMKVDDLWEDCTNEYPTEERAELNLLRFIAEDYGFVFEPTFELQEN